MNDKVKIMKYVPVMRIRTLSIPMIATAVVLMARTAIAVPKGNAEPEKAAVRGLFLGHEREHQQ